MADDFRNTIGGAGVLGDLTVGSSTTGTIEIGGDIDVFAVTLAAGQTYAFDLKGYEPPDGTLPNTFLTLYDPSQVELIVNDDWNSTNAHIVVTASASGTYYLAAQANYVGYTGSYTLSAAAFVDDYRDTVIAPTTTYPFGNLAVGGTTTGNINVGDDVDVFAISLAAGQTYRFDLKGADTGDGTLVDPYLVLYDAAGGALDRDDDTNYSNRDSVIFYTTDTAGTYYLAARGLVSSQLGTYKLDAAVFVATDDYRNTINGAGTLGNLSVDGNVVAAIDTEIDADVFAVTLLAGHSYQFGMSDPVGGQIFPKLTLTNAAGDELDQDGYTGYYSGASIVYTALADGTYYLTASTYLPQSIAGTNDIGSYSLEATLLNGEDDYRNSFADASAPLGHFTVGGTLTGDIQAEGDVDVFAVTLVAGQTYGLEMMGRDNYNGTLEDPYFALLDASGVELAHDDNSGASYLSSRIVFTATTSGTYYLAAESANLNRLGTYTLSGVLIDVSPINDSIDTVDIVDAGDDRASAATALVNSQIVGSTGFDTDTQDFYSFVAPSNGSWSATLGSLAADLDLVLLSSDGTVLRSSANTGPVAENISYSLTSSATYFVQVVPNGAAATPYSLDFNFAAEIVGSSAADVIDLTGTEGGQARGLAGNDIYIVDNLNSYVIENPGEGIDTIQANLSWTLGANIENLTLVGSAPLTGTGNELDNLLVGNSGGNTLDGELGADTLNGGSGADTMTGGDGEDVYYVDNIADIVTESAPAPLQLATGAPPQNLDIGGAIDTVVASITYTLTANVEYLTLAGVANLRATGNVLDNYLTGNTGSNVLTGLEGNDELTGGAGVDTLNGGAGDDALDGGTGADSMNGGVGDDTYFVDNAGDVVSEDSVNGGVDLVVSRVTRMLDNFQENLALDGNGAINGTGNGLNNVITGNAANNSISGGSGSDTLLGGAGDDTYVVDVATDIVTELLSAGTDTIKSSVNYNLGDTDGAGANGGNVENLTLLGTSGINGTGNAGNNLIIGNTGSNVLNGGVGSDTLKGGTGNDTYVVNVATDVVAEVLNAGTDTIQSSVSYNLGDTDGAGGSGGNVENLTLLGASAINGVGNALNNVLTGNTAGNTLNGSLGNDTLAGGAGNDIYVIDVATDIVTELLNAGTDTIQSSLSYNLGNTDGAGANGGNVENLTLLGTGAINGIGNGLNNLIRGNTANNILNGGLGSDTLIGGAGNDIYVVNAASDIVTELLNAGTDTIQSSVSRNLGDTDGTGTNGGNVENLTLLGTAAINGTGNGLNNVLTGNTGNNIFNGGLGNDTINGGGGNDSLTGAAGNDRLIGGVGVDAFVFGSALSAGINVDTITDFAHNIDKLQLDDDIFLQLHASVAVTSGQLFVSPTATTAHDADDRLIYNTTTGALYYDADGNGATSSAIKFAVLTTHPTLSVGDFVVIG